MTPLSRYRRFGRWLLLLLLICRLPAEHLPVHIFTSADGLASDGFSQMMLDSHGYLWFLTMAGISRFDGQSFRNYGPKQGLVGIANMAQTLTGDYWVATGSGLFHYNPQAPPEQWFARIPVGQTQGSNVVHRVAGDRLGGLWMSTEDGLYHSRRGRQPLETQLVFGPRSPSRAPGVDFSAPQNFLVDRRGFVWFGAHSGGFHRIRPDGGIESYGPEAGLPVYSDEVMFEDHLGRIWMGARGGLLEIDPNPQPGGKLVLRRIDTLFGDSVNIIVDICETPDGHLWLASGLGLLEYDGVSVRRYTKRNGLTEDHILSVLPDHQGNLWVSTAGAGVIRLNRYGFRSFGAGDGAPEESADSILAFPAREMALISGLPYSYHILLWTAGSEDRGFRQIQPRFPPSIKGFGLGHGSLLLRDHAGETWIPTHDGVARFPRTDSVAALDGKRPSKIYTTADGLPSNNIASAYEDARGDIWFALRFPPNRGLARWVRSLDRIEDLSGALTEAMPGSAPRAITAYAESGSGTMWFGLAQGAIARYRDGRFRVFVVTDPVPAAHVKHLYIDPAGTLWVGTWQAGSFRVDDGDSERPRIALVPEIEGQAGTAGGCVTGDSLGRIYFGTSSGVERLDPSTGTVLHLSTVDGLPSPIIAGCTRDSSGQLWFDTLTGLARLPVAPRMESQPPPATITSVEVADRALPISDLGATKIDGPTVEARQNRLRISFGAVNFGSPLRYRYKLDGSDTDWSKPADLPMVIYPDLQPGRHEFMVQAVSRGRRAGGPAAIFYFTILPPVWRRWWFLMLAAAALAGAVYGSYRYRLQQVLAVERVRMRIATDLHDDIGSALSQISLLSEVARRQETGAPVAEALSRIATVSRETSASMSDIVWTINPQRDSLGDLSLRIRRFADEMFGARDIDSVVVTPESDGSLKLSIDMRRQLLLVAKEAMHNVIRHAECTHVSIELKQERHFVVFRIEDDGKGFDPQAGAQGHGVASMRSRAERMGGKLHIQSSEGRGATLEFKIPI